jgi:IS5 family transposase
MSQLSLFPTAFKGQDTRLNALGDPLQDLNKIVNWNEFYFLLQQVHAKTNRKNNAGRKPLDEVMMFKVLVLQHHYNLSDQQTEYQIEDRRSFCRFIGLHKDTRSPDEKTIHLFREKLTKKSLLPSLFALLEQQIQAAGFVARQGQLIDASIIPAPIQRNSRKENQKIKEGEQPQNWSKNKSRQKDTQAKWTSKNGKQSFGYKNHINVDNEHKIIRAYEVTSAN